MKNWIQTAALAALLSAPAIVIAANVQKAQGTGVVKAVDARSVTIAHEAIPALKWSAMTMPFPLANPDLAKGLASGQKVVFDVEVEGGKYRITAISAAR